MEKSAQATLLILAALCVLAGVGADPARAEEAKKPVVWPAGEINWSDNPAIKGAKVAVLWGDPKTGGYGALRSLPGGTTIAAHTHTHDQKVLAVSGKIVLTIGGTAKELAAGSYAFIPGGVAHTADCKAGAECRYFEEQQGAADVKFIETTKK